MGSDTVSRPSDRVEWSRTHATSPPDGLVALTVTGTAYHAFGHRAGYTRCARPIWRTTDDPKPLTPCRNCFGK